MLTAAKNSCLYRAFSVFVYRGNKMLLQKRSAEKYHSGGLWTNACCSHPRQGEELSEAVERRLKEELGVRMPVEELYSFVYRAQFENGLTEYEYDHVFLGEYDGEIRLNEEEASEIQWMDMDELAEDLWKNPEKYTAWFLIAAPQVLRRFKA
ncbi:MAG: isopentenyl-diphosphate Delta-isomerase [Schaedlerella sp.]|uniref:isopentenyl-diphosphate Delta-isomerase n=1 Tax=Schaedlerella sp. TaxID=2676057 RepID=UPI0035272423